MDANDLVKMYQQLADVTRHTLLAIQSRDWASYAALQATEDALLHSIKNHGNLPLNSAVLVGLIHKILDDQKETATLILVWQAEIACEIDSTAASRMLTKKYQD